MVDELQVARETAAEAGRLLVDLRADFGPIAPDDKARLTQLRDTADAASNDLILGRLSQAFPGDAILSEEAADDAGRLTADRTWIVDPLDGTWEYGQGRRDFGVHIALWQNGSLGTCVVDLPAAGRVRTSGDSDPLLPAVATDRPLRVVASRTRPPTQLDAIVERWARIAGRPVEVVNIGSVGAKVEEILVGQADAYLHDTGFYEWDLAAPMGVALHYGLVVEHIDGASITFNQMPPFVPSVLVAHPDVADSLREAVRG